MQLGFFRFIFFSVVLTTHASHSRLYNCTYNNIFILYFLLYFIVFLFLCIKSLPKHVVFKLSDWYCLNVINIHIYLFTLSFCTMDHLAEEKILWLLFDFDLFSKMFTFVWLTIWANLYLFIQCLLCLLFVLSVFCTIKTILRIHDVNELP